MAWLEWVRDLLTVLLLLGGSAFCVLGGVGLIRMPELYSRSHAASLGDTLGVLLILAGCALQAPGFLVVVKLVFVLLFLWFTSPIATHALLKAAYARGVAVQEPPRAD